MQTRASEHFARLGVGIAGCVVSVGDERHADPREVWGPLDHDRERRELELIGNPTPHAPGGPPPPLGFRLFAEPIVGGVRSKAIDDAIAKHTGRRR